MFSCNNDDDRDTWSQYQDWREANNQWLAEMQAKKNPDGSPYYKVVVPEWNPATFVLMHYFNDRAETEGNLSPLYTSTIDVRYTCTTVSPSTRRAMSPQLRCRAYTAHD